LQLGAWKAAEEIRLSRLRGSSFRKPGADTEEREEEEVSVRPKRASAAAAMVLIHHKLKKPPTPVKPEAANGESSGTLGSPSMVAGDEDEDSDFEAPPAAGEDEEGAEGSSASSEGEDGSGSDSSDDDEEDGEEGEDDDEDLPGAKRRRDLDMDEGEALSVDSDIDAASPTGDGPKRSRRIAKRPRVDFQQLNQELYGETALEGDRKSIATYCTAS
jgi:hypothetical protein